MKTKLGLLLSILLITVGCNDSSQSEQSLESITNTIGMKLNLIPAGTFMMGSPDTEEHREDNEFLHKVTISKAFYMQTTEVTQGKWTSVMGTGPWRGKQFTKNKGTANIAATYISWDDAVAYCKKLSEKEGKTYRLPTEAEWEYACRAGTQTSWSFGDKQNDLGDYAWYDENAYEITGDWGGRYAHEVGLKKPNAFGLYDMHGNAGEWCSDYYEEDYYKQSPENDPTGPGSSTSSIGWVPRVLRGGSFYRSTSFTRSARRADAAQTSRNSFGPDCGPSGFRVVRELD
jgi:formylglycine-generating enzyme required for sulfatase activity